MLNAPKIIRRFCRQVDANDLVRADENAGIANVASRPMIATTIIISTSVKPHLPALYPVFMITSTNDDRNISSYYADGCKNSLQTEEVIADTQRQQRGGNSQKHAETLRNDSFYLTQSHEDTKR